MELMYSNWQERLRSSVLMKRLTLDKMVHMSSTVTRERQTDQWAWRDDAGSMWNFPTWFLLFSMEGERPAIEVQKEERGTCGWRRQMQL